MHRIYTDRINSRGMSRAFCDLRSQKTPRGILPLNSKDKNRHNAPQPTQQNPSPRQQPHTNQNAEQRRGQEGKSARRGDGLRNYECFPFSQTAARQSAPPKGNSAARECQNIRTTQYPDPTGRNSTVRKLRKEAPAHSPSQEARSPEIPHYLSRASVR